jgi:methionine-gamma-lyase
MMGHGFDPALVGRLAEAADLPHLDLRLRECGGRQTLFEGVTGKRPGGAEGLVYSRFNGPNQEIFEDRLSVWEMPRTRSPSRAACRRSRPCC